MPGWLDHLVDRARHLGFIGKVTPAEIASHSLGFAHDRPAPELAVDLGSGAGIPGLVLAEHWPETTWVFLEGSPRRATFLEQAVRDRGLGDRATVWSGQAEDAGRSDLRGRADLVVARSFAAPAVTAELAAPLLQVGGVLVVSEPPGGDRGRWQPLDGLQLGLRPHRRWTYHGANYQELHQFEPCPSKYPRRVGVAGKRPLF